MYATIPANKPPSKASHFQTLLSDRSAAISIRSAEVGFYIARMVNGCCDHITDRMRLLHGIRNAAARLACPTHVVVVVDRMRLFCALKSLIKRFRWGLQSWMCRIIDIKYCKALSGSRDRKIAITAPPRADTDTLVCETL